jgi:hypothetical protein
MSERGYVLTEWNRGQRREAVVSGPYASLSEASARWKNYSLRLLEEHGQIVDVTDEDYARANAIYRALCKESRT